jgi:hypothetical protein
MTFLLSYCEEGCNKVVTVQIEVPRKKGVNDCGLYAMNGIIKRVVGAPGALTREQMKTKFNDRSFLFRYVDTDAPTTHYFFGERCEHCSATLQRAFNRARETTYKACGNFHCVNNFGPYRGVDNVT